MNHLHTVNSSGQLSDCTRFLEDGDALLLIEDGVYSLVSDELNNLSESVTVYALHDDINARGLEKYAQDRSKTISYTEFIQLCCDHPKVINWF